jgi:hypothetical protein
MDISFGKLVCQCPVAFAATTMPRKRQTITAATATGGSARRRDLSAGIAAFFGPNENCRAPSAGHEANLAAKLLAVNPRFSPEQLVGLIRDGATVS